MQRNDLSNRQADTVAFRIEDTLIEQDNSSHFKNALNVLKKGTSVKLNQDVVRAIQHIFRCTDMTSVLIVNRKRYTRKVKELIDFLPIREVIVIDKEVEVSIMLNGQDFIYYVDSDPYRRSVISNKGCIDLKILNDIIR